MKFKQDKKTKNAWLIAIVQVSITFVKDYFHTIQGFFHTFPYQWSFSTLFNALKISQIFSKLFQDLYESCSQLVSSCVSLLNSLMCNQILLYTKQIKMQTTYKKYHSASKSDFLFTNTACQNVICMLWPCVPNLLRSFYCLGPCWDTTQCQNLYRFCYISFENPNYESTFYIYGKCLYSRHWHGILGHWKAVK